MPSELKLDVNFMKKLPKAGTRLERPMLLTRGRTSIKSFILVPVVLLSHHAARGRREGSLVLTPGDLLHHIDGLAGALRPL